MSCDSLGSTGGPAVTATTSCPLASRRSIRTRTSLICRAPTMQLYSRNRSMGTDCPPISPLQSMSEAVPHYLGYGVGSVLPWGGGPWSLNSPSGAHSSCSVAPLSRHFPKMSGYRLQLCQADSAWSHPRVLDSHEARGNCTLSCLWHILISECLVSCHATKQIQVAAGRTLTDGT